MIIKQLHKLIADAAGDAQFDLAPTEREEFGHYATNIAMRLAKERGKNPREVASAIIEKIKTHAPDGFLARIEAAGPGFINFWITPGVLQQELKTIHRGRKSFGRLDIGHDKRVIVEYSSVNIAKPMHVGHLRSTIIGDAIANILEFTGYKVVRWNYLGDWGTQFGNLIAAYKLWGKHEDVEREPIKALLTLYVKFHDEMKRDASLEARGREEFKKLENGEAENRKLWKWFKKESLEEFENIYKLLGVSFDDWTGESAYEKSLSPLISELKERGLVRESEGALVIPMGGYRSPALIAKSDGTSLYLTRDIASLRARIKKYKPDKILYVIANEQALHLEQLFYVAQLLKTEDVSLHHVKYGLILGEDGKKLSTREGKAIPLEEVIKKINDLAFAAVNERNPSLSEGERCRVAEAVGIGALKYNDLKENRASDIVFDWKHMLDFTGNSAPYLQYTYARLSSILRKSGFFRRADLAELTDPLELSIIRQCAEFPRIIRASARHFLTNNLADYLYKLASLANKFYEKTPILKDTERGRRGARLLLIETVAAVLKNGLGILGIETLKEI